MLLRLLEARFGSVSDAVRDRIHNADSESLLKWSERVLSSETLEAVFD